MMYKKRIAYKLFCLWARHQYKAFLKHENWDFDHASITYFLILKLTIMGLRFAKFGVCVDETRKAQVREIWQARQYLKQYLAAFEWADALCQEIFTEKYGCRFTTELRMDGKYIKIDCTSPVENAEEAKQFWNSLRVFQLEHEREQECLSKAFTHIAKHLMGWWD